MKEHTHCVMAAKTCSCFLADRSVLQHEQTFAVGLNVYRICENLKIVLEEYIEQIDLLFVCRFYCEPLFISGCV